MRNLRTILVTRIPAGVAVLMLATSVFAAPPPMFSYQGRLTDPGGNPVPDGVYSVEFQIWNAPAAGLSLWSSGSVAVTTSDGLFSAKLGQSPQPSLPAAIFYDSLAYLGITVGVDPEISPRTQIVSSPYSLTTGTVEGAQGGRVFGNLYLYDGSTDYVRSNQALNSLSTYNALGVEATRIWGGTFGEFVAFDNAGTARIELGAGNPPFPYLFMTGNTNTVSIQPELGSDNSVMIPDSAISNLEILDEPGIAQNIGGITLTLAPGTYENVNNVTITTPASGYILVTADGEATTSGPAASVVRVIYGLGEMSAVAPTSGSYLIGNSAAPNTSFYNEQYTTSMVVLKPAGTYTFYQTATRSNATTSAAFYRSHMRAFYFPTSYGPVISPVPPSEATAFSESTSVIDEKTGAPMKMVDLRELELKAAKLKAEATAAELALVKARNTQHLNPTRDGSSADDKR